ncbi:MAG: FAD-dependent oxidoreductase [Spirochaetota bacterium]
MKPAYELMFSPISIGSMRLPNRIVHVPTDISSSHADGSVSSRDIEHHQEVARGGAGFIIVGATSPDGKTGRPTVTSLVADSDSYIPGLARLAAAMHRYGAKCAVQLQHPGRQAAVPRYNTMSTNDMVLKVPWSAGHEVVYENAEEKGKRARAMTTEEVLEMIDYFSEAAWRVKQAGYDAVELHAAHGYLIAQFMSPYTNRRIDRFGGSFDNRMRFPLAIIDSIQQKCGKDFPILIRYSVDEWIEGGRELQESLQVAKVFEEAGVAALDLSQCITETPGAGFDPMFYPQGWTMYASEAMKKEVSIPIINSHTLRDPDYCESLLKEERTDMIGLSRQLLADPYWPLKAKIGKVDQIRKCISCLSGCWNGSMLAKTEISCSINAGCGDGRYTDMKPAEKPMKIAVVGGGPAGMEAARISAVRGHNVTLFEQSGELGGAILGCCMVPGKEKMKWYADWIRRQIARLPVTVNMNHCPDVEELKKFDTVLYAAGASSYTPEVPGLKDGTVLPFESVIACPKVSCEYHPGNRKPTKVGENVLLWGDHYAAVDTAIYLASIGKKVTIVTENRNVGEKLEPVHMYVIRKRFKQTDAEALSSKPFPHPVDVLTSSSIVEIKKGSVIVMGNDFKKKEVACDTIVNCNTRPNTDLLDKLKAAGVYTVNVGDSSKVRGLHEAVKEGSDFGFSIDGDVVINPNEAFIEDVQLDITGMIE